MHVFSIFVLDVVRKGGLSFGPPHSSDGTPLSNAFGPNAPPSLFPVEAVSVTKIRNACASGGKKRKKGAFSKLSVLALPL